MTLLAAGAAGFLLWFAPHFHRWSTGGYWAVIALMAGAGVLIGLSQLHARDGNPAASFLVAFVPVLVAAGWVILAVQPQGNWIRDHVLSWSGEMGIGHAVHNLGEHVVVLAFGLGIVFGLTFEPRMVRRGSKKVDAPPAIELAASTPQPVSADRAWQEATVVGPPAQQQQEDATPTVELAASSPQPVSADPGWEEATAVEPPAQQPEDATPTVELAASNPEQGSADRADEGLTAVKSEPTAVESPAREPQGGEQGAVGPPA